MKTKPTNSDFTRLDRIILHVRCLWGDHKLGWHLAGVWREVTLFETTDGHR